MFKWLLKQFSAGEEDVDSLESRPGIEAFVARLSLTQPAQAVEAVSEQFETAGTLELSPAKLRRALKRLDEYVQNPLAALGTMLFEDKLGRQLSDTAWLTLARHHRNVHTGYAVCLDAMAACGMKEESDRSDAVLIRCRAMSALARYKALLRMRYRDVDPKYWEDTMRLASGCAGSGSSTTPLELYPGTGYQTTFERELLIALLFEAAPIANLLPPQLGALDLILRRFRTHYAFSDSYHDSTPFVIDREGSTIARRWLKGLSSRPGLRFFGPADACSELVSLEKQAKERPSVPSWLAPACLDVESYRTLLDLLVRHWSGKPPQRHYRRHRRHEEVLVAHGLAQLTHKIAQSAYVEARGQTRVTYKMLQNETLFARLRADTEEATDHTELDFTATRALRVEDLVGDDDTMDTWTVTDMSDTGLGAEALSHEGWAHPGRLVGLRRVDRFEWQLAVVRRLKRSSGGKLTVGMTIIPGTAYCTQIRFSTVEDDEYWMPLAEGSAVRHDAILLRHGTSLSLVLSPGTFTANRECMILVDKKWHSAALERRLERGYDYEQVGISPLSTEPADAPSSAALHA